ncbi:transcription factor E2F3 [Aulostomus maculatus]
MPNPQPGGPGAAFCLASTPETCLVERRLKLESGDHQDLQDGSRAASTKMPTTSMLCRGESPATSPVEGKTEKTRVDSSLGVLTLKFADMIRRSNDGVVDLNAVAQELNTSKRRIYDVTNVLEGIKLLKKKSKNLVEWQGTKMVVNFRQELEDLSEKERRLDELIQSCLWQIHDLCEDRHMVFLDFCVFTFAYLTYEDVQKIPSLREQTVLVIQAPAETKLEVPHPEDSLQLHLSSTQGPIEVFLCHDDPTLMDATDGSVTSDASDSHSISSTNGTGSKGSLPSLSFVHKSSKDNMNQTASSLCDVTQRSSPVTPAPPLNTSLTSTQPPSEDQLSFVSLNPSLALSLEGEKYVLNLDEDEGITDLFSSADLEHEPLDAPPL